MVETIIVLFCLPLDDHQFREVPEIAQYANQLSIKHYTDEYIFDVKDLYKKDRSNCYWVSIEPALN